MKITIKARLLIAGIFSIIAILVPIEGYLFFKESASIKTELKEVAANTSLRLSKSLASPLWDLDDNQVYDTIQSEMMEKRVFAIQVTGKDKEKINYGKTRDDKWKAVQNLKIFSDKDMVKTEAEILKEESSLGFVTVYVTEKFMKERLNAIIFETILKTVILCVILSAAIFIISRILIFVPLNYFQRRIIDIAQGEGDLTKRLPEKKDEIGELAYWFNIFLASQQKLIKEIASHGENVLTASDTLTSVSEEMNKGVNQISDQANSVASGSEEMNSNMSSISAASEQANQNINMVASAAEELASTIKEISQNSTRANEISEKAVELTSNSSAKVEELGKEIENIGKVTDVITDISDQTNLLALNATIEAARAGEAGKGFAVVANEIKELAKQTAEATQEIKSNIDKIQSSSLETIEGIEEVTKVINDTNELVGGIAAAVEEQSATTDEIANNVTQASLGINEVAQNIGEVSNVSSEISEQIAKTSEEIDNISVNSDEVNSNANSLSKLSGELKQLLSKFKV